MKKPKLEPKLDPVLIREHKDKPDRPKNTTEKKPRYRIRKLLNRCYIVEEKGWFFWWAQGKEYEYRSDALDLMKRLVSERNRKYVSEDTYYDDQGELVCPAKK